MPGTLHCAPYAFCRDLINCEIPGFMRNDRYQIENAGATLFSLRGAVLEEALRTGYISCAGAKRKQGTERWARTSFCDKAKGGRYFSASLFWCLYQYPLPKP